MYTAFSIKNFRCIKDLTVEPLARVNLIVGKNNRGKTALLEALWLHSGPNLPDLGDRLARFRGIPGQDPERLMHDLFHDFDPKCPIILSAKGIGEVGEGILNIRVRKRDSAVVTTVPASGSPSNPPRASQESDASTVSETAVEFEYTDAEGQKYVSSVCPTNIFISPRQRSRPEEDVIRFGKTELEGYADRLTHCLKRADNRIKRLLTIASPPAPMIYADVGLSRPVPVGFLGDGVGRLLSMALAFHDARGGMIFIDEVENGLHHSVLEDVWKELNWLSKEFDVQVFATTHSGECMHAARAAFNAMADDTLCIHRLSLQDKKIAATTYSFEDLDFTLDYGAEMR